MIESADRQQELPRAEQILTVARTILEQEGRAGLTMRAIAESLGIRAPSLYKHFRDKSAIEIGLIEIGFQEWSIALQQSLADPGDKVAAFGRTYRRFGVAHPHLYRLITEGQLPRSRIRPGSEENAAAGLGELFGSPDLARAAWAFAHGMTILEIDDRFPPDADLDAAWACGLQAFSADLHVNQQIPNGNK